MDVRLALARLDVERTAQQLLLPSQDGEMGVLGTPDLLHRGVVADRDLRQALAVAVGDGDVQAAAVDPGNFLEVEIGPDINLSGIGRFACKAAGRVGRSSPV